MTEKPDKPEHESAGPARRYSWPPFEEGNTVAMRHGATSPRVVGPIAERLAGELAESAPWTAGRSHAATVSAWSHAEAQCAVLRAWLDEQGLLDGEGNPRPATRLLDRVETRAASLRAELGLSPMALAKLLTAVSGLTADAANSGLDALRAEGRRIVEARTAALEAGSAPGAVSGPASPDGDDHAPAPVTADQADHPLDHEETSP